MTKLKDGEMVTFAELLSGSCMYSKHSRIWGRFIILLKSFMFLLCWDRNIVWVRDISVSSKNYVAKLSGMRFRA